MFNHEIVISGIAGRFPRSPNIAEFAKNLYAGVDLVDDEESRWRNYNPEVPRRWGKVGNLEKFDAEFFSTLKQHADFMDPQVRMLLEHSYEAILDAGISPQSLIGSRTGVFIGCGYNDACNIKGFPKRDGLGVTQYVYSQNSQNMIYNNSHFLETLFLTWQIAFPIYLVLTVLHVPTTRHAQVHFTLWKQRLKACRWARAMLR